MRAIATIAAAGAVALALAAGAQAAKSHKVDLSGPLVIKSQGSFFVGGRKVHSDTIAFKSQYSTSGTITVDQIYVHYQIPMHAERAPNMVLIHGCCLTGKTWETTPDGRMGWDEYFLRNGYPTYVIDQSWRGRSAADPSDLNAVHRGQEPVDKLPATMGSSQELAWVNFRMGPKQGEQYPGNQYPAEAIDEFYKQLVPDYSPALPQPNPTVPNLSLLSQKIGKAVLVSHSQSGIYPFQTEALSTAGIAGIVSIEPGNCPDPKGPTAPYAKIPTLVIYGDYVQLSDSWRPRLADCRAFADKLNAAGGHMKVIALPDIGIHGNDHMMMQDKNSLQVADVVIDWIRKNALKTAG